MIFLDLFAWCVCIEKIEQTKKYFNLTTLHKSSTLFVDYTIALFILVKIRIYYI